MSLQFILGNAGSGKSVYLYQTLIQASVQNPKKKYMIIVPEQFTLQTQKELVSMHPGHSVMNIEVLSFDRLAYRVFDEMGTETLSVLEDTGKNLVLRRVAEEKMEQLQVLRGNMTKPGYISEVKSLISEFKQYDISPQDFADIMEDVTYPSFRAKAQDILVLYEGFQEFIKDKYITSEEILELLIQVVKDSILVKDSIMVFDGFTGFTPIQNKLLRTIMPMVENMICTITMDSRENYLKAPVEEELFYMSKRMAQGLIRIAQDVQVDVKSPILQSMEEPMRFTQGGELLHLEENLFRKSYERYKGNIKAEPEEHEIEIYRMANPRMELSYVAARIQKMIRTGGYHYRDFAIVCSNMADYQNYIRDIFQKYEMPIFVDSTSQMAFQPCIEFVRSAMTMVEENFSYSAVLHFLRCGLTDLTTDEIDRLDNYIRSAGIRGKKRYFGRFAIIPQDYTVEDVAEINGIREKFISAVEPFYDGIHSIASKPKSVGEMTRALYNFMCYYDVEAKLQQRAAWFLEQGDGVRAKEYQQIYGILMDLLDKVVTILGEDRMDLEAYHSVLDAGLDAAKIGVIPPSYDNIIFGDMERTRLEHIRVLFLIGANDGAIPKAISSGGILSQLDRQKLKDADYELAPTEREKAFMQRYYLYLILSKPSEKLIVTYGRTGNDGNAVRRSYLVQVLMNLFPELPLTDLEELPMQDRLASPIPAREYVAEQLRDYAQTASEEMIQTITKLYGWLKQDDPQLAKFLLDSAFYFHKNERIEQLALKNLTGESIHGSVSRIEKFSQCAYAYFLQYGLKLQKRQEHTLGSMDMGNLYHDALDRYSKKLEDSAYNWYSVSEEESQKLLEDAVTETFHAMPKAEFFDEAKEAYILNRMRATLERTVRVITKQIRQGRFIPKGFEVDFRQLSSLSSLQFQLEDGKTMKLNGKIDRLDKFETQDKTYVKIVDYKSGKKKFDFQEMFYGLQMQLILYMSAALESESQRVGEAHGVEPGGMLYYTIDDPILDIGTLPELSQEDWEEWKEQQMMIALRGDGLVNEASEVIEALDDKPQPSSPSLVIPVKYKKDLSLGAGSETVTTKQFQRMESHVKRKIYEVGTEIASGNIDVAPYKLEQKNGCMYCDFQEVCGFDRSLPGYTYRKLKKMDKDEVMRELAEEEEDE